jgi:hypothetical protein
MLLDLLSPSLTDGIREGIGMVSKPLSVCCEGIESWIVYVYVSPTVDALRYSGPKAVSP